MTRLVDGLVFVAGWSLRLAIWPGYVVVHALNAGPAERFAERLEQAQLM